MKSGIGATAPALSGVVAGAAVGAGGGGGGGAVGTAVGAGDAGATKVELPDPPPHPPRATAPLRQQANRPLEYSRLI
ncbi:MAG: hypothetical protein NVSMB19_18480 [Vulcanimicrobiaceae bacterium]